MPKIIFVNPPVSRDEIWGEFSKQGSILPPLGLAILAAVSRNAGFDTKIMDFMACGASVDAAVGTVAAENPDYVGITSTTDMIYSAAEFAVLLKKADPRTVVLLGGPHISAVPVATMERFAHFDFGFVGESENTLADFLKKHSAGADVSGVSGLLIRHNGKVSYTGQRSLIQDMDRIPPPAWDLLPDLRKYYRPALTNFRREPATSLVTSRGCPGKCVFCDASVFGRGLRAYSAGYVVRLIEHLAENFGIKEVCFYDDNFTFFRKRLEEICGILCDKKINISWSCNARVNLVDPGMLALMKRAGCWQISYGIESGSQKVLDNIKKGVSLRQAADAVTWTKQAGISPRGFFMLGNPGENKDDIEATRSFMLKLALDDVLVEYFTPYPGTEIYAGASEFGEFDPEWRSLNTFNISFVPHGLSRDYLARQFKRLYRQFYLRPRIILNYLFRLGSPKKIFVLFIEFIRFTGDK